MGSLSVAISTFIRIRYLKLNGREGPLLNDDVAIEIKKSDLT